MACWTWRTRRGANKNRRAVAVRACNAGGRCFALDIVLHVMDIVPQAAEICQRGGGAKELTNVLGASLCVSVRFYVQQYNTEITKTAGCVLYVTTFLTLHLDGYVV